MIVQSNSFGYLLECECTDACVDKTCDNKTGQCKNKPNTTGDKCQNCKPGFWKKSVSECEGKTKCAL